MIVRHPFPVLLLVSLVFASCAGTRSTVQHDDDVYFMPSQAPPVAAKAAESAPAAEPTPAASDDYYDEGTSQRLGTDRGYYDMAYNDPYYYNYGRFGFGMGWQSGWNGPGWGMGYGWGTPGNGWGSGYGSPWGTGNAWGWNQPYGWGNDGWGYGGYNGWGNGAYNGWGYGGYNGWGNTAYNGWGWGNWGYYGNYWSPYGACHTCYTPIIIGGGTYVGHRRPMNRSSSSGSGAYGPRAVRDPVGLSRSPMRAGFFKPVPNPARPMEAISPQERSAPQRARGTQPTERAVERKPMFEPSRERQPSQHRSQERPAERAAPAPAPAPRDGGGSAPGRHRSR